MGRYSFIIALALTCLGVPAKSEVRTVWAKGLQENESGKIVGWYDYNKEFNEQDFYMCWAAATSNLISWWQDLNPDAHAAASDPEGAEIWKTYQESFSNDGSNPYYGLQWWMDGSYPESLSPADGWAVREGDNPGGYYKDYLTSSIKNSVEHFSMATYRQLTLEAAVADLVYYLNNGYGIALGLKGLNDQGGHSITLWGVEYESDSMVLTKVYVTDSDDHTNGWERVQDGLLTLQCTETSALGYDSYSLSSLGTGDNLWYHDHMAIMDFTAINSQIPMQLPILPDPLVPTVPEPTTGTLGLLALAGLCIRRRRK